MKDDDDVEIAEIMEQYFFNKIDLLIAQQEKQEKINTLLINTIYTRVYWQPTGIINTTIEA